MISIQERLAVVLELELLKESPRLPGNGEYEGVRAKPFNYTGRTVAVVADKTRRIKLQRTLSINEYYL